MLISFGGGNSYGHAAAPAYLTPRLPERLTDWIVGIYSEYINWFLRKTGADLQPRVVPTFHIGSPLTRSLTPAALRWTTATAAAPTTPQGSRSRRHRVFKLLPESGGSRPTRTRLSVCSAD